MGHNESVLSILVATQFMTEPCGGLRNPDQFVAAVSGVHSVGDGNPVQEARTAAVAADIIDARTGNVNSSSLDAEMILDADSYDTADGVVITRNHLAELVRAQIAADEAQAAVDGLIVALHLQHPAQG